MFSGVFGDRVPIFRLNRHPTIQRCHWLYGLRYNHIQLWRRDRSQEPVDNENPFREIPKAVSLSTPPKPGGSSAGAREHPDLANTSALSNIYLFDRIPARIWVVGFHSLGKLSTLRPEVFPINLALLVDHEGHYPRIFPVLRIG